MELPGLLYIEGKSMDPNPDVRGAQLPTSAGGQVTPQVAWLI